MSEPDILYFLNKVGTDMENIRKELAIFLNLCYCVLLQGGEAHEQNAEIVVR